MALQPAVAQRAVERELSGDTIRKIRNITSIIWRNNKAGKDVTFLRGVLETLRATDGDYLPAGQTWPAGQPPPKDLPEHQKAGAAPAGVVRAGAGGPPPVLAATGGGEANYFELLERFRTMEGRLSAMQEARKELNDRRFCNEVKCAGHDVGDVLTTYACPICKRTFLSGCEGDFHCHNGDNEACPAVSDSDPIAGKPLACADCFTGHPSCCATDHSVCCDTSDDEAEEEDNDTATPITAPAVPAVVPAVPAVAPPAVAPPAVDPPVVPAVPAPTNWASLLVPALRKACADNGLASTGNKAELVARLNSMSAKPAAKPADAKPAVSSAKSEEEESEEEEEEEEGEEEEESETGEE